MKILCIGAGAIGICIGGSLAAEDQQVYFLVKPKYKAQLSRRELSIEIDGNTRKTGNFHLISDTQELSAVGELDCVLIAVKAFDTDQVIRQLKTIPVAFKSIGCLQNGVENEEKFAFAFPEVEIIAASIVSAVSKLDDASVRIEKNRGIGLSGQGKVFNQFFDFMDKAGLKPQKYPNSQSMKWSKMISNLFANALSGILDMTPAEIYSRKGLYLVEKAQILEGLAVMQRMGLKVENLPGLPLKVLACLIRVLPDFVLQPLLVNLIAKGRGEKMPSFYIEKMKGSTRSEVNYLNGAIVRYGEQYGVDTPVNRKLTDIFNAILNDERIRDQYSHTPDLLEKTITMP